VLQQLPLRHHALGMLHQVDEYEYKIDCRLKPGTPPRPAQFPARCVKDTVLKGVPHALPLFCALSHHGANTSGLHCT
jgi:hypothetical protein